jgi:cell division protein FtsQ
MRPLIADRGTRRAAAPSAARMPDPALTEIRHDPAPSIWTYRAQRLWLTPVFRRVVRLGLPSFVVILVLSIYIADASRRTAIVETWQSLRASIEGRPEFQVNLMGVHGASDALIDEIRTTLALSFPVSSFDLDLPDLRARIEALPAVARADLRIQGGGYLAVQVTERVPVAIFQTREALTLIDNEGQFVANLGARALDAPLPLIGGDGADLMIHEALALHAAAAPLADQLRGLVRMGERRWDVVLTDDRRILLPETGAAQALDRALALHDATDILGRDILRIDLRDPDRLTVQLTPAAIEALRLQRSRTQQNSSGEQRG